MNDFDFDELRAWLREAGVIARQHFNHVAGRRKADSSWVTEADEAIERVLAERIAARYPQHGVIGEEQTRRATAAEFLWAIDPLDGTASFVAGLPLWSVSLGLLRHGVPYLGLVYVPLLDDCYWAGPEGPAFLNGRPIHVAAPRAWDSEDWIAVPSNSHRRFTIDFLGRTRAIGSTAASFCYVARGAAVGALVGRAGIWDVAAGLVILRAAGGIVASLSGAPLDIAALLDGKRLPEPVVVGAEAHVAELRAVIQRRQA
jgi:myo-inositol-1(or 4)-monophosphatase